MIIHYLRVKNFCGITEKELRPQTKGITIIEGPNEVGKSCFVRALYILLEEMDSSAKKSVQAIQPVDQDVGPEIDAEIESGSYRFRLFKRYMKDKATVLTMIEPSPGSLKGREAHNRVQEILGETMDMGLWKALNVIQGESDKEIPTNSSLSRALSNAAGTVTVGKFEQDLYESVRIEKEKYCSSRGPTGEYKRKIDLVEALGKEATNLQDQLRRAEGDIEEFSRLEAHLRELDENRIELERDSKLHKENLDGAKKLLTQFELAGAKLAAAISERDRVLSDVKSRAEIEQSIKKAREFLKELEEDSNLDTELEASERAYLEEKQKHQLALGDQERARVCRNLNQKDLDYLNRELWLSQLRERLGRVENAQKVAEGAAVVLARHTVTEEALEEIREAQVKMDRAKGALEIGLPSLRLEALDDIDLLVDESPLKLSRGTVEKRTVLDETTIELPGKLAICVNGGRGHDKLVDKYQKAEDSLRKLLESHNVTDLKDAYLAKQLHQDAQKQIDEYERVKKNDLRDLTIDGLIQLIGQTEEQSKMHLEIRPMDVLLPKDLGEAEALLRDSENNLDQAEKMAKTIGKELEKAEKRRDSARTNLQDKESGKLRADGELTALNRSLESARIMISDEDLDKKKADSEESLRTIDKGYDRIKEEVGKLDVPSLEILSRNAESALVSMGKRIDESKQTMDGIGGRLELYEQDGLAEKVGSKEREFVQARKELASLARQAEAAKLLFETMNAERIAAQMKFLNPLKERIERLGRILFNTSFKVTIDENLNVVSRTLDGKTLGFDQLSTGAKEQIGMISKLACAMIVSSEGGVPLILDDALGHTDPTRIKAMDAILTVVSQDCQIILMTCYPSRYTGIGGALVDTMGSINS